MICSPKKSKRGKYGSAHGINLCMDNNEIRISEKVPCKANFKFTNSI